MSAAEPITNHTGIREWAEKNGGRPCCVKGTGKGDDPGILRLDFGSKDDSLEESSWEKWFKAFDKNKLALLRSEDSRFNKLISRD